jgi:PAS domain S-box-containing protein
MTSQPHTSQSNPLPDAPTTFVVVEYDVDLHITHISSNIEVLTGEKPQRYIGQSLTELIYEPDADIVLDFTQHRMDSASQNRLPCRIFQTRENILRGELKVEVMRDDEGQWQRAVGLITLKPKPSPLLMPEPPVLRSIADSLPDVIYIYNLVDKHILYINAPVEKIFGAVPGEIIGHKLDPDDFVHPDDRANWNAMLEEIQNDPHDRLFEQEFRVRHYNGNYVVMNSRIKVFTRTQDGAPYTVIGNLRDMSDHQAQAQREIEARTERERLHFLSQFIRSVSHDFRTPLSIINSSAYFLVRKEDMEERRVRAELIEKQVSRLEDMLDQVALSIHVHIPEWYTFAPVDMSQIITEVISENENRQNVRIETGFPSDARLVRGDIVFLKLAVDEIYKNALQYTQAEGTIRFELTYNGDTATIEIVDTGDGIEPDKINHIFEYYFRADPARSLAGNRQHTGLGLAIVKKIIHTHDGQIRVESQVGAGSRFVITLPLWEDDADGPR